MRLLQARRSPFCIKVRLVISHLGLTGQVSMVDADPWTEEAVRSINPLCKVPTLLLDDGTALHDSPVICEFLNAHAKGELIPVSGATRWSVLSGQAVADGLAEAVIRRHVEGLNPWVEWSQGVRRRQELAITAALETIDATVADRKTTLAGLAAVASIHYLDHRSPEIAWRDRQPRLARWFDESTQDPRTISVLGQARHL